MATVLALVTFKVFPPHMGGQRGVALFYKHLSKYLMVTMAATPDNDQADARSHGVDLRPVLHTNRQIVLNLGRLTRLLRLVKETAAEVLISEHSFPAFMGLWLRKKTGTPLIIHSHNIEAFRFRQMGRGWWKVYLPYERWVHRKADFNFFISQRDLVYALQHFDLQPEKCAVITYGIEQKGLPPPIDKAALKRSLGFSGEDPLFLFNGTLDYTPNIEAAADLMQKISPLLFYSLPSYKIVVTGNRTGKELIDHFSSHPSIIYRGFVEDIDLYYQAADLFLNPVTNDSGVKTKVIEALANNCSVVSFMGGASGIPSDLCGGKLVAVPNGDYEAFSRAVVEAIKKEQPSTPAAFYEYYNWDNIAQKAAALIRTLIPKHV